MLILFTPAFSIDTYVPTRQKLYEGECEKSWLEQTRVIQMDIKNKINNTIIYNSIHTYLRCLARENVILVCAKCHR